MRIAANPGPYYDPHSRDAHVTVDGRAVERVIEADEEGRWADVIAWAENEADLPAGAELRPLLREDNTPHPTFRVARLTGDVRITFDEEDGA